MPPASVFAFPAISVTAFSTDAFSGAGPPQVLIDDFFDVHAFLLFPRGMTASQQLAARSSRARRASLSSNFFRFADLHT